MSENIILGIPCKFSEFSIIPKHIYEFFNGGETAKCRGNEFVTLELLQEYTDNNAINADLNELFGISIGEYTSIWEKRVDALKLRENGWVKVRMRQTEDKNSEKA